MLIEQPVHSYFADGWNVLDFSIVVAGSSNYVLKKIDGVFISAYAPPRNLRLHLVTGVDLDGAGNAILVFRLLRLLRIFRVLKSAPQLRIVVKTMILALSSVSGCTLRLCCCECPIWKLCKQIQHKLSGNGCWQLKWVSILIFLLLYVYAVMGVFIFGDNDEKVFGVNHVVWSVTLNLCVYVCSTLATWASPSSHYSGLMRCTHSMVVSTACRWRLLIDGRQCGMCNFMDVAKCTLQRFVCLLLTFTEMSKCYVSRILRISAVRLILTTPPWQLNLWFSFSHS